jgi:hypothetical protein
MSQPTWKLIAQLGDVNPTEYGGYFIYQDETGVYCEEGELLEIDESSGKGTVYRFILEKCTLTDGILSDNKFHPLHPAWFAKPESERSNRPQDNTYLKNVGDFCGKSVDVLTNLFCSEDAKQRAVAYREVGIYHGFNNLDSYPLQLTENEVKTRYATPSLI